MCISLQSFLYVAVGEWNFVLCTLPTEPSSRLKFKVLLKSTTQWLAKDMEKEQKRQKNEAHSSLLRLLQLLTATIWLPCNSVPCGVVTSSHSPQPKTLSIFRGCLRVQVKDGAGVEIVEPLLPVPEGYKLLLGEKDSLILLEAFSFASKVQVSHRDVPCLGAPFFCMVLPCPVRSILLFLGFNMVLWLDQDPTISCMANGALF